jgi:hypothetical protein
MKSSEAKALIGKRVHWIDTRSMFFREQSAVFVEVRGRNVHTEDGRWLWLPDIKPTKTEDVA